MSRYQFTHVRYRTAAAGRARSLAYAALLRLTPQATIALVNIITALAVSEPRPSLLQ